MRGEKNPKLRSPGTQDKSPNFIWQRPTSVTAGWFRAARGQKTINGVKTNKNTNKCTLSFNALYFTFIHSYMFRPYWAIQMEIL
jgi:hypothetical protein